MFSKHSAKVVAPVAQTLTANNRVLALKSESLPLAVACEAYNVAAVPNRVGYSHRLAVVSQEEFAQANDLIEPAQEATYERQATLMAQGLQAIVFTARNVIIPTITTYATAFQERQASSQAPRLLLKEFEYAQVHNEPSLVNHVQTRYARVTQQPSYRTFLLGQKTAEEIIELAAVNNPHLDQQQVTEWLLTVGAERIQNVWTQLFNSRRAVDTQYLDFVRSRHPRSADELLLAYCLAGHFIENPVDEPGESVSLEDWSRCMQLMHEWFGALLVGAYHRRVENVQRNVLVLSTNAENPLKTLTVEVEVNGDIYEKWLDAGGSVEAVLGAAVYQSHLRDGTAIAEQAEKLARQWNQLYPLMRQAAVDMTAARRRKDVTAVLMSNLDVSNELPELTAGSVAEVLPAIVASLDDAVLSNPFNLFANVVCRLYYSNPIYLSFLNAFEQYSKQHPLAAPRELALYSLIEVAAEWLANQATVTEFKPSVDPNAVLTEVVSAEEDELSAPMQAGASLDAAQQPQVELVQPSNDPGDAFKPQVEASLPPVQEPVSTVPEAGPGGYTMAQRLERLRLRRSEEGHTHDADGNPL